MADTFALRDVEVHARNLDQPESRASLVEQAADCAYIVQALGYYDLAYHLKTLGADTPRFRWAPGSGMVAERVDKNVVDL